MMLTNIAEEQVPNQLSRIRSSKNSRRRQLAKESVRSIIGQPHHYPTQQRLVEVRMAD